VRQIKKPGRNINERVTTSNTGNAIRKSDRRDKQPAVTISFLETV
jgi:hypothetical protein